MLDLWVALAGPAGGGKSTLSRAAGATMRQAGILVDVCSEDELFTRPEFDNVARQFQGPTGPTPEELEAAYAAWLANLPPQAVAVTDWHPAGMAGDLPWAVDDRPRLRRHLQAVRRLATQAIVVTLQLPAEVAVARAVSERGESWLIRSDFVALAAGHDQPDRWARLLAWTQAHNTRTGAELEVAASAGWLVNRIDASGSPQETLRQAMGALSNIRRGGSPHLTGRRGEYLGGGAR